MFSDREHALLLERLQAVERGITVRVSGPLVWTAYHKATIMYPVSPTPLDVEAMAQFHLRAMPLQIDCDFCKKHWLQAVMDVPRKYRKRPWLTPLSARKPSADLLAALRGPVELFSYGVALHNRVNRAHGRRELRPAEALEQFGRMRAVSAAIKGALSGEPVEKTEHIVEQKSTEGILPCAYRQHVQVASLGISAILLMFAVRRLAFNASNTR